MSKASQEAYRKIREGGWIYTGDRFVRDAEGFHFFRGRADDLAVVLVGSLKWVQVDARHVAGNQGHGGRAGGGQCPHGHGEHPGQQQ